MAIRMPLRCSARVLAIATAKYSDPNAASSWVAALPRIYASSGTGTFPSAPNISRAVPSISLSARQPARPATNTTPLISSTRYPQITLTAISFPWDTGSVCIR